MTKAFFIAFLLVFFTWSIWFRRRVIKRTEEDLKAARKAAPNAVAGEFSARFVWTPHRLRLLVLVSAVLLMGVFGAIVGDPETGRRWPGILAFAVFVVCFILGLEQTTVQFSWNETGLTRASSLRSHKTWAWQDLTDVREATAITLVFGAERLEIPTRLHGHTQLIEDARRHLAANRAAARERTKEGAGLSGDHGVNRANLPAP